MAMKLIPIVQNSQFICEFIYYRTELVVLRRYQYAKRTVV